MLSLLALSSLAMSKTADHKVIFLLDVSSSMCGHLANDEKVDEIRITAKQMLSDSKVMSGIHVSFYKFGDIIEKEGEMAPNVRIVKDNLSPEEALDFVDEFFVYSQYKPGNPYCKNNVYPDPWTYVASSVRYVLTDILELPSDPCDEEWTKKYNDETNPAPFVTILGITDYGANKKGKGTGEDSPCGSEQTPSGGSCSAKKWKSHRDYHATNYENIQWMNNESNLLENFNYQFWNIDKDNKNPLTIERNSIFYRVKWYGPNTLGSTPVNLEDAKANLEWEIKGKELPKIRLHPLFLNPQDDSQKALKSAGVLFEGTNVVDKDKLKTSPASTRDVSLIPVFDYTSENDNVKEQKFISGLQVQTPERHVDNDGNILLEPLELTFSGTTKVRYESADPKDRTQLAAGENSMHVLRVATERLAEDLSSQYPNSSFLWSAHTLDCETEANINVDYRLPPVGRLPVERKDLSSDYTFEWQGTEESLDNPFTITFDRLWRAYWVNPTNPNIQDITHTRLTSMSAKKVENNNAAEVFDKFTVEYKASAKDADGNDLPIGSIMDMKAFKKDGTIIIPPKESRSFDLFGCQGFCYGKDFPLVNQPTINGPIVVNLEVVPLVTESDTSNTPVVKIISSNGTSQSIASNSVTFELNVEKPPLHYVQIVQITLATIISIWFISGWKRRPRFPKGVYLGLDASLDLRKKSETFGGTIDSWKYMTFRSVRKMNPPVYFLQLDQNIANSVQWNAASMPADTESGIVIGVAPHRNSRKFYIWCASTQADFSVVLEQDNYPIHLKAIKKEELFRKNGELNVNSGIETVALSDVENTKILLKTTKRSESVIFNFKQSNIK